MMITGHETWAIFQRYSLVNEEGQRRAIQMRSAHESGQKDGQPVASA